ncbi:nickel-dependent hydrogenase large subunit [Caldimonas thermodepolymerans]|uniref:HupV protein n=1 Tax=Caldimonas thermodepolymerans TaxID=215580 RepID=A0A2S5T515_9BURK|nr:nickel-dependent hydrogenase large subunit [Caldimonas thermodepolymerans]PPE70090.1 HupV protein [Caldimonas thermodepolymerans]QPC31837.1 nickel-dependent hydrogenase large subunit [Caldimonas thermodepolymerans]RDI01657.1 hydrogenase large subunit [Caldimonas thermodepolymerans]
MNDTPARRLVVGPFNRVEGDLEVRLDVAGGVVRRAEVNAPMYRGFEQMLPGRHPMDALVIVPRICGICSVSQSLAAARALAALAGAVPPPNGLHALNILGAVENVADHLTHFYVFFMPDFAREVYAKAPWHEAVRRRFAAQAGEGARAAIVARQRWFTIVGTLGGKWPHTQSVLPGGSSRAIDASERLRLLARVREFRQFLETQTFASPLEDVASLDSRAALDAWRARGGGDLRLFLDLVDALGLERLGPGPGRYLSYGAYPQPEGGHALAGGYWNGSAVEPVDLQRIREDVSHAWYAAMEPAHPSAGATLPQIDKPGAYSWAKAPRYGGEVLETGALARQVVAGHPLVRAEALRTGGNVYTRVLARLLEMARVVPMIEAWLQAIVPGEPFHAPGAATLPGDGQALGTNEAARGSLLHALAVRDGRITRYQIVAPTTWNFSPRDAAGVPGPLEAALAGTPVQPGEDTPVAVQHVVRSFDPCMVCTVH